MYNKTEPQPPNSDHALIDLWVSERMPSIIDAVNDALGVVGFETRTYSESSGGSRKVNMHVSMDGSHRGVIDITRIMLDIATTGRGVSYDRKLANPLYEVTKTRRTIGKRIAAAKAVFRDGGTEALMEASKRYGIRFLIIDRNAKDAAV